ncbi:MAG: sigma-E processing peptidase SpoIIGA [Clostridia bacterium]|nr:sigma-E processing peptidase SpoIIGA [Clostridia bacterium]
MYIELFLLDNLLMNLIILRLASAMLSVRAGIIRTTLFALFGAVIAALGAGGAELLLSPAAKLILTALMSLALPVRGAKRRALAFLATFVSAAAVGGAVMLTALILGGELRFGAVYSGLSLRTALIGGAFAAFLPNMIRRVLSRKVKNEHTVRLRVILKTGENIECAALIDSGNLLFEPVSALPVIVLCAKRYLNAAKGADIPIPARTAAGSCTLYALKPRRVFVNGAAVDALIAFSEASTALVPLMLVQGGAEESYLTGRNEENAETASGIDSKTV